MKKILLFLLLLNISLFANEEKNLRDYFDIFLFGDLENNYISLPIAISTTLLEIFREYVALFLTIVIGIMGWQKFNGVSSLKILVTGGTSMLMLAGMTILTDSTLTSDDLTKLKQNNQLHYLLKGEVELIKMGEDIADDLWKTLMFGRPDISKNGNETIKKYSYDLSNGFFINRFNEMNQNNLKLNENLENEDNDKIEINDFIEENINIINLNKRLILLSRFFLQLNDSYNSSNGVMVGVDFTTPYTVEDQGFFCSFLNNCSSNSRDWENKKHGPNGESFKLQQEDILTNSNFVNKILNSSIYKTYQNTLGLTEEANFFVFQKDLMSYSNNPLFVKNKFISPFNNVNDGGEDFYPFFISKMYFENGFLDTFNKNFIQPFYEKELSKDKTQVEKFKILLSKEYSNLVFSNLTNYKKFQSFEDDLIKKWEQICTCTDSYYLNSISNFVDKVKKVYLNRLDVIENCRIHNFFGGKEKVVDSSYKFENDLSKCLLNEFEKDKELTNYFLKSFNKNSSSLEDFSFFISVPNMFLSQYLSKTPLQLKLIDFETKNLIELYYQKGGVALEDPFEDPFNQPENSFYSLFKKETLTLDDVVTNNDKIKGFFTNAAQNIKLIDSKYATNSQKLVVLNYKNNFDFTMLNFESVIKNQNRNEIVSFISEESIFYYEKLNNKLKNASWMELGSLTSDIRQVYSPYIISSLVMLENQNSTQENLKKIEDYYSFIDKEQIVNDSTMFGGAIGTIKGVLNSDFDKAKLKVGNIVVRTNYLRVLYEGAKIALYGGAYAITFNFLSEIALTMGPAFAWFMVVFVWYVKASLIIALLPLSTFMVFFVNFEQFKNAIITIIKIMIFPVFLVSMFFIITEISVLIPIYIDKFLPILGGVEEFFEEQNKGMIMKTAASVLDFFNFLHGVKSIIILFVTFILYSMFFRVGSYVDLVVGGVSVDYNERQSNKILQKFKA